MDAFAGFDPQVGEIRALRSFRIDSGGALVPLFQGSRPWTDGDNTAYCARSVRGAGGSFDLGAGVHEAPDPDCSCGFYAYGSEAAASEYPHARYVLAVVACWGHVIAGTRGLRAGHARIEALWLSDAVPLALGLQVANRYPGVETYSDRAAMLREHAPTQLDCYEPAPAPARRVATFAWRALVAAGLVFGLVPMSLVRHNPGWFTSWLAVLGLVAVGAVASAVDAVRHRGDPAAARRIVVLIALALWMFAAFAMVTGTLVLRLPLLQLAVVTVLHRRRLDRVARRFPARIAN